MAAYETKLKLGRKLEGVDAATASANQVSVLFRVDEDGKEDHVSMSIEADGMSMNDVAAVLKVLDERGVLRTFESKTWLTQPQASREKFGETTEWGGADVGEALLLIQRGLGVRESGGGRGGAAGVDARAALRKIGEVERKLTELKRAIEGSDADGEDTEEDEDEHEDDVRA